MRHILVFGLLALIAPLASAQTSAGNQNQAQTPAAPASATALADELAKVPDMDRPTEAQIQTLSRHIVGASTNPSNATLWQSARNQVSTVILMQSCYGSWDVYKILGRYTAPGNGPGNVFNSPMSNMDHHPKSQCLTVDRINDIKATAKNAISFRVMYVSDASGEGKPLYYEIERQPDDAWLFKHGGL